VNAPAAVPAAEAPAAWRRLLFRLRLEEAAALLFLLPTSYITLAAYAYVRREGILGSRYPGGVARLAVAVAFITLLFALVRRYPASRAVTALRETLPFLTCILIYTNLHDTIGFVNPHDVHDTLIAIDQWLFGLQPCVWAERFVTRGRTELMSFFYWNFFWIALGNSVALLALRRWRAFRTVTITVVTCFFMGYALYVVFPAAPPRLVLRPEFTLTLQGYPAGITSLGGRALDLLPVDSRGAFPSLHAAVSLVALVTAFRHLRRYFYVLLPFVLGLWVSTIYLRHHYVIDLLAGWALAPVALWVAPRLDRAWSARQRALGYATALGSE
jgi:membrane-associated phospholipid phosphatase